MGPIVRYVDETAASIWLEVDTASTLVARATPEKGAKDKKKRRLKAKDSVVAHTVKVGGRHYALLRFEGLSPGTVYAYQIHGVRDERRKIKKATALRKAKGVVEFDLSSVAFDDKTPALRTLPHAEKEPLRVTFGSCRCFAGGYREYEGVDVLARYAVHLLDEEFAGRSTSWPHVLLLLGDQIYADDVATEAVKSIEAFRRKKKSVVTGLRNTLCPNWQDLDDYVDNGFISSRYAGTGEFRCRELEEYAVLYEASWRHPDVRLLFANIPTYMLPDDHEVANTWDITGGWREQVLNDPDDQDWLFAVRDGLLAYWLYQGWGNLSSKAASTHPIVSAIEGASTADALDDLRDRVEDHLYGATNAPVYFTIPTTPPIIAIDTRSDREFVAPVQDTLSNGTAVTAHAHPDDMILSAKQFEWLEKSSAVPALLRSNRRDEEVRRSCATGVEQGLEELGRDRRCRQ